MSAITNVPLLDTRRANDAVKAELQAAFDRVMSHGHFILGEEVEAFEKDCARYLGVEHAIGVSSGTDALLLALMALGIGAGDEVLCPTYTFFATAGSIWRAGARPVFVDSKTRCFNCDPEDVARKITPRTRAIIPVHLFGQCADMEPILKVAKAKNLAVIEDAAQAIGAEYRGKRAGGLGTIGCFSFFPSKNLGGMGDGGLVTTNDSDLAKKLRALRTHGGLAKYEHPSVGGNFRLDALQAALLGVKLKKADQYTEQRQRNAARYTKLFTEAKVGAMDNGAGCSHGCPVASSGDRVSMLIPAACQNRHVFNQYCVRLTVAGQRDQLQSFLKNKNIGTAIYYPKPMHMQGCFASLGGKVGDFPVAERLAQESLAIPIYSELAAAELEYVAENIIAFLQEHRG